MSNPALRFLPARPASPEVGDCWYDDGEDEHFYADRHRGKRALIVTLPKVGPWCVYSCVVEGGVLKPERGWDVSGEVPNITLTPSLDFKGLWHGWITNGMIITC